MSDDGGCLADVPPPDAVDASHLSAAGSPLRSPVPHSPHSAARKGRGAYAFTHPEWDRPWRSKSQQRFADAMARKEIESESYAQKNAVLRRQLQLAEAELKKGSAEHGADLRFMEAERRDEMKSKDDQIERLRDEGSRVEMALQRQLVALQRQRDDERRTSGERIRSLEKELSKQSEAHSRAVAEMAQRGKLEMDSMMKVVDAKEKELSDAEARHRRDAEALMDARDTSNGALLKQLHEIDDNWRRALDQQQDRTSELRKQDLVRISSLEADLLQEKEKQADTQKKLTLAERKKGSDESASSLWTAKITAHVDTMVNSFSAPPPTVEVPQKDKPQDPLHERLWQRLMQLWELIKDDHAAAKKTREDLHDTRFKAKEVERTEQEKWDARRRDLSNVEYAVDEVRQKQDRLGHAFQELRLHTEKMEEAERHLSQRLRFFIDDAVQAEEARLQPGAAPAPKPGTLSVVAVAAAGTPHWSDRIMHRSALDLYSRTVRAAAHRRGGYETVSRGDTSVYLFLSTSDACGFALDLQLSLYSAKWSDSILRGARASQQDDQLWRGVCARVAVHHGSVKATNKGPLEERRYAGEAMLYCAALLGKAAAGQIVVSGAVWDLMRHRTDEVPRCEITSLGAHTVAAATDPSGATSDRLMQLVPHGLAGRRFPPITHVEAENSAHFEPLADALRKETLVFHTEGEGLRRGLEVVSEELEQVGKAAIVCTGRLRSLQAVKPWKPQDLVSAFASIDELVLLHDTSRKQLEQLSLAQEELMRQQHGLEAAVSIHSHGLMTELEHRREMHAMKQAHQEELVTLQSQCKAEAQRLLVNVVKAGGGADSSQNLNLSGGGVGGDADALPFPGSTRSPSGRARQKGHGAPSASAKRGAVATWARSKRGRSPATPSIHSRPDSLLGGISFT